MVQKPKRKPSSDQQCQWIPEVLQKIHKHFWAILDWIVLSPCWNEKYLEQSCIRNMRHFSKYQLSAQFFLLVFAYFTCSRYLIPTDLPVYEKCMNSCMFYISTYIHVPLVFFMSCGVLLRTWLKKVLADLMWFWPCIVVNMWK